MVVVRLKHHRSVLATGVMKLIKDATYGTTFLRQIHSLHGMFGAWDNAKPGSFNLFPNQFNIAADIEAAQDLLIRQKLDFPMFLVPTETCKDKRLSVTPDKLRDVFKDVKMDSDMIVKMYQLWFDIQGRRPFFIFDMAPVLSASAKHSNIYSMLRIKAMYDMGVVRLREIDEDMPIDPSNNRRMASKCLTGVPSNFTIKPWLMCLRHHLVRRSSSKIVVILVVM